MDSKSRRLSVGGALKKAAAEMDTNDDDAEREARRKSRIDAIPKAPTISAEITSSWLRIFSEGKLGKKDVWNVPVTDMLAKEGQSENVDFRDASLTIDASAHVYSKRVEEVLSKTTTLAGGLASEDIDAMAHVPDEEANKLDDDVELEAKEEVKQKRKRVVNRGVSTLETNEASLSMKRNDREYAVDPLFHKRSAIFDSGGAKGLLLNVLSVHNGFQLVFDSVDLVEDSTEPMLHATSRETENELRHLMQAHLKYAWQDAEICPEYAERRKGSSVALQQLLALEPEGTVEDGTISNSMDYIEALRDSAPAVTASMRDNDEELAVDFSESIVASTSGNAAMEIDSSFPVRTWDYDGGDDNGDDLAVDSEFLEARLQRIEEKEHETENLVQPEMEFYEMADGPNAEYTYFNRDKLANWSGPEHWKHKNMKASKRAAHDDEEYQDEDGNIVRAAKSRGPRKQFRIDFHAPPPINLDELLAPAGTGAILPKTAIDKQLKEARMLLIPPDINYDVANFSATFLPHHVSVAMRRRAEASHEAGIDDWRGMEDGGGDDFEAGDGYENLYRDVDMPDAGAMGGAAANMGAPVAGITLRPGDEGYLPNVAKIDKRVDVKALKHTIWKELCASKPGDSARVGVQIPTQMSTEKPFQSILEQLPQSMSEDVVREVSVPYCFVCLLHLANEKHLSIRQDGMDALFITQTGPTLNT